jgi:hypothetical protein
MRAEGGGGRQRTLRVPWRRVSRLLAFHPCDLLAPPSIAIFRRPSALRASFFGRPLSASSFRNVGRNRRRGPPNLSRHPEQFILRKVLGHLVTLLSKRHRRLPNNEIPIARHQPRSRYAPGRSYPLSTQSVRSSIPSALRPTAYTFPTSDKAARAQGLPGPSYTPLRMCSRRGIVRDPTNRRNVGVATKRGGGRGRSL